MKKRNMLANAGHEFCYPLKFHIQSADKIVHIPGNSRRTGVLARVPSGQINYAWAGLREPKH